jgi:hypothetical protein
MAKQEQRRPKKVRTEASELETIPTTISLLLKCYSNSSPFRKISQEEKSSESKVFLSNTRERRVVTNMKLHKEIFFK